MAGPMPGLLTLMEELYGRINKERLFGGGVVGAATRGLLGAQPAEDMTPTQRDVYDNAVRLAAPALGAGKAAITAASAVKLGKMSKDEFLGAPKIVGKKDASALKPMALKGIESEAEAVPFMGGKYTARYTPDGAAVYDGDKVIASYNFGDTLVVDPKYRKQGIGEELVYQQRTFFPEPAKASTRNVVSQRIQENVWDRIQNDLNDPSKTVPSPIAGRSLLEQAPQAQAMETARQNAVKMLGLPESNTAMDRARAMGFDRDLYHGASKTPERSLYEHGVYLGTEEPRLRELTEFIPGGGRGEGGALFGSDLAQVANSYAIPNRAQAGAVYPLKVRSSDLVEAGFTKDYPINGTKAEQNAWMREAEAFNRLLDKGKNRYFSRTIKENPGKSVVFKNTEDAAVDIGSVAMSDIYAITGGPVRSRFAAFDPAKINEKDILASLAAMGITLPLLMGLLSEQTD